MQGNAVIIGISPGTRHVGFAVMRGTDLHDFRIMLIRDGNEAQRIGKLRSALAKLIGRYTPTRVAMKHVCPSRSSRLLDRVVSEIGELLRSRSLALKEYTIEDLKRLSGGKEAVSRYELAKHLASCYPVLARYLRNRRTQILYHMRMFEAVAAARVCAASEYAEDAAAPA